MGQPAISYTNRIEIDGREMTLEELTEEERTRFGDLVRTRPLQSMGYLVEENAP